MSDRGSRGGRRAAFGLAAAVVAAVTTIGTMPFGATATAAPTTFNPFSANRGFTMVVSGDARLGNSELEGAIAVLGTVSSAKVNGYALPHVVAGRGDYAVPLIDGTPVRILADRFAGPGGFDVTNSGAPAGSDNARAVVKIARVDELSAQERGGFTRVVNADGGVLDLKALAPYDPAAWADVVGTVQPSASDYFPDLAAHLSRTNRCLASMYDGLANDVSVAVEGGMVFLSGFASDRPNVLDLGVVPAGAIIKMDRAGGYRPSAQAPLVVRVPAGTATISRLNIEGWSAAGDQELGRSILFDLSAVDNPVRIDGMEMGSVWAPGLDVTFDSNITTNGQWMVGSLTTASAGELHHHAFVGQLPCDDAEESTTTSVPESSVPESSVPESSVPESSVPESSVPESSVPESSVPAVTTTLPAVTTTLPAVTTTTTTLATTTLATTTLPATTTSVPAAAGGPTSSSAPTTRPRPGAQPGSPTTTAWNPTPVPQPGGSSGTTRPTSPLPATGTSTMPGLLVGASGLIAVGALLVLARRRPA